jgi:type II secretion system protein G
MPNKLKTHKTGRWSLVTGHFPLSGVGFTLIELLVVMAIIGTLSTLLVANFNAARERSRDAQRKSDLRNIQTALRIYYNDYGQYPDNSGTRIAGCGGSGTSACSWGSAWTAAGRTYMNTLPDDPVSSRDYRYNQTDDENYTLEACLENKSDDKCSGTAGWCTSSLGCIYSVKP